MSGPLSSRTPIWTLVSAFATHWQRVIASGNISDVNDESADSIALLIEGGSVDLYHLNAPAGREEFSVAWHRSSSAYEAAVSTRCSDAEAAIVAGQGWGSLVQAQVDTAPAVRNE